MRYFFIGLSAVALALAAFTLLGWTTMTLWNWLLPTLLNLPVISFWQALGLLLLSRILFGNWGGGGSWKNKTCGHQREAHWKNKIKERWNTMSETEQNEWRNKFEKHCGANRGSFFDKKQDNDETV